jgi:hypothetical protein
LGARKIGVALSAALPFALAVAAYNAHFFGSPFRFGYQAALGPHAGLGLGVDPWGNSYGLREAFAYTSAELTTLSLFLLETPLPIVLAIGAAFALTPPRNFAPSLLFWWVVSLVIADLFYWHHGLFRGPRMLADEGPLWVLLAVYAVAQLIKAIPRESLVAGKYSPRAFALTAACAGLLAGIFYFAPERLINYAPPSDVRALLKPPALNQGALVFVHGGWTTRVAMRLAGNGMRLDSVETVLRQNSTCAVSKFSNAYAQRGRLPVGLDFVPRATDLPATAEIIPGDRMRVAANDTIDNICRVDILADLPGVIDVTPYIWQGDLPGISAPNSKRPLFVRDMSPRENDLALLQFRDRIPLMLTERNGFIAYQPYREGMREHWSAAR